MHRPRAALLLRQNFIYRREVFEAGLKRLGYDVQDKPIGQPEPSDLLVLWNRNRFQEHTAQRYQNRRAQIIVAENGYIGTDDEGGRLFALAKKFHNGAGEWRVGGPERLEQQHIDLKPWRESGENILLLPQRGIGPPGVAMPFHWEKLTLRKLEMKAKRPVHVRPHPGTIKKEPHKDFRNCFAVVTWGSGAAIKAIASGIPCFYEFPQWIGGPAATFLDRKLKNYDAPFMGDRLPMFQRLAWAQWATKDIESGDAFAWLLR